MLTPFPRLRRETRKSLALTALLLLLASCKTEPKPIETKTAETKQKAAPVEAAETKAMPPEPEEPSQVWCDEDPIEVNGKKLVEKCYCLKQWDTQELNDDMGDYEMAFRARRCEDNATFEDKDYCKCVVLIDWASAPSSRAECDELREKALKEAKELLGPAFDVRSLRACPSTVVD